MIGETASHFPNADRAWLPFRAVNRRDSPGFAPGMQRHHLLPRQLLHQPASAPLFSALGRERLRFDDFRSNGLPLHRGPHRSYTELVSERVGQIEADWARGRGRTPEVALVEACARLRLLQRALRRRLLDQRRRLRLSRNDPLGAGVNFAELDALVNDLWPATAEVAG